MAGAVRLHRKQFLLAPRRVGAPEGWCCVALGPDRVLLHCPELIVSTAVDRDGLNWLLLGRAVESDPLRSDPLQAIAQAPSGAVPDLSHGWAGRWLLLGGGRVFPDASGLLGCFYCRDDGGEVWLSSSPALLVASALGGKAPLADDRKLTYDSGVSWFPPPRTRFAALRRLLPSQSLSLAEGTVLPRRLMPPIDRDVAYGDARDGLARRLTTILYRLAGAAGEPLWLGLTAGYDSRLMLALAAQGGIALRPFTRLTPRMSVADRVLPPRLAKIAGFAHRTTRPAMSRKDRRALLQRHALDHVSLGDARPFLTGERDGLDGISIGGHGFAIAGGFADWRSLPAQPPSAQDAVAAFFQRMGEPPDSRAAGGLCEWFDWAVKTPEAGLDWRDRLYLEQRQAGWLAAKEQVSDMNAVERFPVLNCAALYATILGIEEGRRSGSDLQRDLIAAALPALLDLPFNPPDRAFLFHRPDLVLRRRAYRSAGRLRQRLVR